jgi:uncharacterized protein
MSEGRRLGPGEPRSAGSISQRRVPQAWPKDRRFRILSIDGGGIRGIFPAAVLARLEERYTGGGSIGAYFDLVSGTSTGGILALGLGAGYTARELLDLYVSRGNEVFPPCDESAIGRLRLRLRDWKHYTHHLYDRDALRHLLSDKLGERLLGESKLRLCIPAFEGKHSEVFVFKTPHHPDYKTDLHERMVDVALATAAAPTYFQPLEHGGYTLVDGGVWCNNPIMLAVVEALTCFDLGRDQIDVLSLGCGDDKYIVSRLEITRGGLWHWKRIMEAAMRLQSTAAANQARLLLGPASIKRLDAPEFIPRIRMDDWRRSVIELIPAADAAIETRGDEIGGTFLVRVASPFLPICE